jgi:hypothetical protein
MSRRRLGAILVLVVFVAISVALFRDTWFTGPQVLAGYGTDPLQFVWYMQWTPWALSHLHDPLVTTRVLYPEGANLMWNTSVVFPAFVLWPVTATLGPAAAYNVLMTLGPPLSAWTAFLALRRWRATTVAAAAGALLYGFSPLLMAHAYGHPNITLAVYPPLALMLLHCIVVANRALVRYTSAVLLGIASTAQLLISAEVLADTAIAALLGFVILGILHRRRVRDLLTPAAAGLGTALAVFLVTAAIPLRVLLFGPQRITQPLWPPNVYVQDLAGLVVPGMHQQFAPHAVTALATNFSGDGESAAYVGIPLLLLCGFVVWRRRTAAVVFAAILAACLTILALGPTLHVAGADTGVPLPWTVLGRLPLLQSALPARLMLPCYLALGIIVAAGVDMAIAWRGWRRRTAGLLGVAASLAALTPVAIPVVPYAVPSFFTTGVTQRIPNDAVAVVTPFTVANLAMLWQAEADFRYRMTSGAMFLPGPRQGEPPSPLTVQLGAAESDGPFTLPDAEQSAAVLSDLRRLQVSDVVVGPSPDAPRLEALFTALLGRPAVHVGGVALWTGVTT